MIHIDSLAKPHEPDSHLASRDYKHHIFEKKVKSPEISNNEVEELYTKSLSSISVTGYVVL